MKSVPPHSSFSRTKNPMVQKMISIRGANEHNLKKVDLDIPRDKMVVITGLSGSGKSTLAFDTIYAKASGNMSNHFPPMLVSFWTNCKSPISNRLKVCHRQLPLSSDLHRITHDPPLRPRQKFTITCGSFLLGQASRCVGMLMKMARHAAMPLKASRQPILSTRFWQWMRGLASCFWPLSFVAKKATTKKYLTR